MATLCVSGAMTCLYRLSREGSKAWKANEMSETVVLFLREAGYEDSCNQNGCHSVLLAEERTVKNRVVHKDCFRFFYSLFAFSAGNGAPATDLRTRKNTLPGIARSTGLRLPPRVRLHRKKPKSKKDEVRREHASTPDMIPTYLNRRLGDGVAAPKHTRLSADFFAITRFSSTRFGLFDELPTRRECFPPWPHM